MKLQDFRNDYYTFSGKASDIARTLALSAIAVVWIFRKDAPVSGEPFAHILLPKLLLFGAIGAVLTLSLDLCQYTWAAAIYGGWSRFKERRGIKLDAQVRVPPWFNWPTLLCFWLKLVSIGVTYYFLARFLVSQLRVT
jgi:hypothetical protein